MLKYSIHAFFNIKLLTKIIIFTVFFLVNKTCSNRTHSCNCDYPDAKWHSDEGHYQTSKYGGLGITKMVFLKQDNLQPDALGRVTLGPLECVETSEV